ncbi:hypothetical protein FACS1894139_04020 [Planctomycetales bacterium]|nr:hypothetical protein FACS1894108_03690 [Planctomycetales bacterium]GHT03532.1 hypothetical protein FACS1894139_04020 [Planctomycetales bacterium]
MIKLKQNWLPKTKVLVMQLVVSAASFITLPFYKAVPDGVRKFFYANYCEKPDGLIFDGATLGYFSKIEHIIDLPNLGGRTIFDIGCGEGTLVQWLTSKNVSFKRYIGLDFAAIPESKIGNVEFLLDDAVNVGTHYEQTDNQITFMVNAACYFENNIFENILCSFRRGDEIVIIEPSPNIFWDAHFNGVKPVYRKIAEVERILDSNGFSVLSDVQDYWVKTKRAFFIPLSYGIFARKL